MNKNTLQGDEVLMNPLPKNRKGLLRFLISIFCFSLTLCSCSSSNDNIADHSVYLENTTEENGAEIKDCHIILPSDASPELIKSATRLSIELSDRFGIRSTAIYDSEPLPQLRNTRLIFLGNTSYDISALKISRLKINDFVCASVENDIVLGGKSSSATVAAIERFISDVLPYFDIQDKLSDDLCFEYHGEYLYTNITVNGYSLDDYTIAYPSAETMKEKAIAHALRDRLANLCGAYPDIVESRYVASADRIICVGACFGEISPEAQILSVGSNIILCGESVNLIAESAEYFIELCSSDNTLEIVGQAKPESQISTVTLTAEFPTEIREVNDLYNIEELCKRIKQNLPTIVCFEIPSDTELAELSKNLTEYTHVGKGLFILSRAYTEISATKMSGGVLVDISIGISYRCRIIAADATECTSDTVASSISDDIPTVIFALNDNDGSLVPNDSREILSAERSSEDRKIFIKALAPHGSAEAAGDRAITLTHSFLR